MSPPVMFRHLPPTATPIRFSQLTRGFGSPPDAVDRFRTAFAQHFGVSTCQVASSGRAALYLLLKAFFDHRDHDDRREVVMPAYTCPSLAKVALDLDLRPRLVDLSPLTFAFEAAQLETTIGRQTLAVICVHPFGMPQPIGAVQALAHAAGAVTIEDAAQSMGARLQGTAVGTVGDFGLFSLGPGKPISVGGGGIVTARDPDDARLLDSAWQNLPRADWSHERLAWLRLASFSAAFRPAGWWLATHAGAHRVGDNEASWGYSLTGLTNFQAALAHDYLAELDAINAGRRANAERMLRWLQTMQGFSTPASPAGAEPIYLRLPIIAPDERHQARLFDALWSAGIGVGRMYKRTIAEFFPQLADRAYPGAQHIAECLLTLPTHHFVTEFDQARMQAIFQDFALAEHRSGAPAALPS